MSNPAKPGRRSWVLIGSMALNVFLAAWLIAGVASPHFGPYFGYGGHPHHRGGVAGIRGFVEHGMDNPAFRALHEKYADRLRTSYRGHREGRHEFIEMLREGGHDRAELEMALNEMAAQDAARRKLMHEFFLDAATSLSKEELEDLFPRIHRHHGPHHE